MLNRLNAETNTGASGISRQIPRHPLMVQPDPLPSLALPHAFFIINLPPGSIWKTGKDCQRRAATGS